jgi:hypothetical protein
VAVLPCVPTRPSGLPLCDSDLITFEVRMPFNDQVVPFVHVGMVQADSIAFGTRPEDLTLGRLVEFTAARAK